MRNSRLRSIDDTLVYIENEQSRIDITEEHENMIRNTAMESLKQEGIGVACEVDILLTDDEAIRQINARFRNVDAPTDVLSFPMASMEKGKIIDTGNDSDPDEGLLVIGDIVISVETAMRQSEQYGHSFEREIAFLTAHGMYHLMGYDHEVAHDEKEMTEKQEAVLGKLGLRRA